MTPGPVISSTTATAGEADRADRVTCTSTTTRWRSAMLRVLDNHALVDDALVPAVPDQMVMLVARGTADVEVSTGGGPWKARRLRPGSVSLTSPDRPVRVRWRPGPVPGQRHRTMHLYIPAALIARTDTTDGFDLRAAALARQVRSAATALRSGQDDLAASEIAVRVAGIINGAVPATTDVRHDDPRVRRAMDYLEAHPTRSVSLTELADLVELSPFHFARLFQATTGEAPHAYQTRLRLEAAARLLRSTDDPVWSVAYATGFGTHSHFAAVFRAHVGASPTSYRRAARRHWQQDPDSAAGSPA